MRAIFVGKPVHWLIWIAVALVFVALGPQHVHTKAFNLFAFAILGLAAGCVLWVRLTTATGEQVTRDAVDESGELGT